MSTRLKGLLLALALAVSPALVPAQTNNDEAASAKLQVSASEATPDSVRKSFEGRFPGIQAKEIRRTPFPGLFEVQIGRDLLYTNATADFVLQGALIDAKNRRDLTAERMEELSKVAFETLPLELAVQQVKGDGSRKIAVFEDPNCGYCKRLHQTLTQVDNITV